MGEKLTKRKRYSRTMMFLMALEECGNDMVVVEYLRRLVKRDNK